MNHFRSFLALGLCLCPSAQLEALEIGSRYLTLRHDSAASSLSLTRTGQNTPSLRFQIPGGTQATSDRDSITLALPTGPALRFTLPADSPFALVRGTLTNRTAAQTNTPVFRLPVATLDLGVAVGQIRALGTAGLTKADAHPGSYVFLALADPASRAGLVAGWTSFERADGTLFSGHDGGSLTFAAQNEFGRLLLEPGTSAESETLALGFFDDVRLGLEQWADLTAATNKIKLRPQRSGYCTWYSQPHGGASDEAHIKELTEFAARELKPYGFDYIQIDDKWQDGTRRKGPSKVFERVHPKGPYPSGMKPAARAVRDQGLLPGIWYMPFAGDQEDPWFADKQHWFVKRQDGSTYFTNWGGGSLDLSHPEVQTYIRDLAHRIGQD